MPRPHPIEKNTEHIHGIRTNARQTSSTIKIEIIHIRRHSKNYPTRFMTRKQNMIRNIFRARWALGALTLVAAIDSVYLIWDAIGLSALAGGTVGIALPLPGPSKPWAAEDQLDHDRRWKRDGSPNDDGLPT
ncbi:hypothetical protein KGA65_19955 [Ideonella sp. B7]|uniref:hypothetical protein n=1 Tax=Ideonella benzenivorans TaxID=2831643 RepID=UPI001CECCA49|nr:hypothetical protein [Ideonella benzenivorans]MCA6218824.1 hypothetical protein [Ideonella benzenivorans]